MRVASHNKKLLALLAACALGASLAAKADDPLRVAAAPELAEMSLEQLADVVVTSASRRAEKLIDVPASLFVISAEDIRRSGATNIVQALRLAPNLFVGLGDANQAIIGARGQYAGTSNKMLVLVDGRTIYTPLFSGVFWDAQFLAVEDIERIEVISGPAATLWGSNGVNGVINIISRPAGDTKGVLATAFGGNAERGAMVRQGGAMGEGGAYRVYARYRHTGDNELESGASARDASERMQAGFRTDWQSGTRGVMLQGDAYKGDIDNLGGDRPVSGGHLLARWDEKLASGSSLRVTAYYDRTKREHVGTFKEQLDIADIDVQHESHPAAAHTLIAGGGYRYARDDIVNTPVIGFDPARASLEWANVFLQDEWNLARDLELTTGLKAERNPYTGLEWLPTLRLGWTVAPGHFTWAALSRALRAPSRIDRDAFAVGLRANDTFQSEVANVAELGYRAQLTSALTVSATAFYHRYPNLRSVTLAPDATAAMFANGFDGRARGIESWATWQVSRRWRLSGGFTALSERFTVKPGQVDLVGISLLSNDPRHTAQVRSSWDIGRDWEADLVLRNVGRVPFYDVREYTSVDARVGWRVHPGIEIAFIAQNFSGGRHEEFGPPAQRAAFDRAYLVKVTWQP